MKSMMLIQIRNWKRKLHKEGSIREKMEFFDGKLSEINQPSDSAPCTYLIYANIPERNDAGWGWYLNWEMLLV